MLASGDANFRFFIILERLAERVETGVFGDIIVLENTIPTIKTNDKQKLEKSEYLETLYYVSSSEERPLSGNSFTSKITTLIG